MDQVSLSHCPRGGGIHVLNGDPLERGAAVVNASGERQLLLGQQHKKGGGGGGSTAN